MDLKIIKPTTDAERTTQTTLDTWEITPNIARSWKLPTFQRPLRVNDKVIAIAKQIAADGGVIPGVFCIGILEKERWLVDGQHRREAFLLSECSVGYVDARVFYAESMAEMADEFVRLNSRIVNMRPDDIVRGLEASCPPLAKLRKRAPFIGYDQIRRSEKSPVLSASQCLRCWAGSAHDVPHTSGTSAAQLAAQFSMEDSDQLVDFLDCCITAWGRDAANARLWGGLNLTICAWLWRRLVLTAYSTKTTRISKEQFAKCLMSLSAATAYVDWLLGRQLCPRDLAPAYDRIKKVIAGRIETDTGKKVLMPAPPWASSSSGRK